jgi:hypothetical protein
MLNMDRTFRRTLPFSFVLVVLLCVGSLFLHVVGDGVDHPDGHTADGSSSAQAFEGDALDDQFLLPGLSPTGYSGCDRAVAILRSSAPAALSQPPLLQPPKA